MRNVCKVAQEKSNLQNSTQSLPQLYKFTHLGPHSFSFLGPF